MEISTKLDRELLEKFEKRVINEGRDAVWASVFETLEDPLYNGDSPSLFSVENLGELYEKTLAWEDKDNKKSLGQYYTPSDVSHLMGKFLKDISGKKVCDVACGCGSLIMAYLDELGEEEARELLSQGDVYLYDMDPWALRICAFLIKWKYHVECKNVIEGDFLCDSISLPENCKVISNPPYGRVSIPPSSWGVSSIVSQKEMYTIFMDKILRQSCGQCVLLTPYSFIMGDKFFSLRQEMHRYASEIFPFDNIPGKIFLGKKEGIFNSNKNNSVRACISVFKGEEDYEPFNPEISPKGTSLEEVSFEEASPEGVSNEGGFDESSSEDFHERADENGASNNEEKFSHVNNEKKRREGIKVAPLIRFNDSEREELLQMHILRKLLPSQGQISLHGERFFMVNDFLLSILHIWQRGCKETFEQCIYLPPSPKKKKQRPSPYVDWYYDIFSKNGNEYNNSYIFDEEKSIDAEENSNGERFFLYIPMSCRYRCGASISPLQRKVCMTVEFKNFFDRDMAYLLLNSSFGYLWWRMNDGGITLPRWVVMSMPIIYDIPEFMCDEFTSLVEKLKEKEGECLCVTMNKGEQETIKRPWEQIHEVNEFLLKILITMGKNNGNGKGTIHCSEEDMGNIKKMCEGMMLFHSNKFFEISLPS